jgi:RimJ/RimL family protein N-acetyltransferase
MDVQQHRDPRVFQALAEPFYATDTLRHTVALTVMARFLGMDRPGQQPVMATLHDDSSLNSSLIGVALRTPPWPLIVSGLPTDSDLLETFLTRWLEVDPEVPGVAGPLENAHAVAGVWTLRSGGTTKVVLASRLFRLDKLSPPETSGQARDATRDDMDLLVKWREDFEIEALGFSRDPGEGPAAIRRMFDNGDSIVLWEERGEPVSWAAASAPIGGMSRVGPVYTPPEHRQHGYGSAVTAATSQRARDAGARDVILFTDITNPTSNSIYQKIGYRPVYDSTELEFVRLPSTV